MTLTLLAPEERATTTIPPELDPRLASYVQTQVKRLRVLDGSQRAFLVLERYPELRDMALVDWERLSYWPAYSVLYGAASRHFARVQLAALQGILLWTGATPHYLRLTDTAVRHTLQLLQGHFGIRTPADLTFDSLGAIGTQYRLCPHQAPVDQVVHLGRPTTRSSVQGAVDTRADAAD